MVLSISPFIYSHDPLNMGLSPELLRRYMITPISYFFVRNHGNIPEIDPDYYRLEIGGLVRKTLSLSLDDLRREFPKTTITATLQCAGNRRRELHDAKPIKGELMWGTEAMATAVWGGVALQDILDAAGVRHPAAHVAFTGLDEVERRGNIFNYGTSIPLEKAYAPEVILAYEMNGESLPYEHGFPLRVVVPGYIGARSVKWLGSISVQEEPSDNYFQQNAYKLFLPYVTEQTVEWNQGVTLDCLPVNSVICTPQPDEKVSDRLVHVQGIAVSSGQYIESVELSTDGGKTWRCAPRLQQDSQWAWCFWESRVLLPPKKHHLVVRATDQTGATQPESLASVWNFKGYANNAWHRVKFEVTH